eukprot:TRINITY_DN1015_c0_g1_i5.p1 TRINITY_DN1015_c0_g1~~TRINITY_DN1015_c0_g1_i5.p1  ORF type:complete len:236 (+),score=27.83 TRINITY_DN1015_c0_g1_i5:298-1005(+)
MEVAGLNINITTIEQQQTSDHPRSPTQPKLRRFLSSRESHVSITKPDHDPSNSEKQIEPVSSGNSDWRQLLLTVDESDMNRILPHDENFDRLDDIVGSSEDVVSNPLNTRGAKIGKILGSLDDGVRFGDKNFGISFSSSAPEFLRANTTRALSRKSYLDRNFDGRSYSASEESKIRNFSIEEEHSGGIGGNASKKNSKKKEEIQGEQISLSAWTFLLRERSVSGESSGCIRPEVD